MYTAGIDEVGRGALAGPAAVGAVCLAGADPEALVRDLLAQARLSRLADSKKLTRRQRERAYAYLEGRILWAVGRAEAAEIDQLGISPALRLAAGRALDGLRGRGAAISGVEADASLFHPYEEELPTNRTVKGDETILEITFASIMAKVWRDRLMAELATAFPGYGWERNAGYGTPEHLAAIRLAGKSFPHRESFLFKVGKSAS
jgi:ribonuclease HII